MNLDHLSVSTIESFSICPRRAYLRKTVEMPVVLGDSPATRMGRAVHEALEIFHEGGSGDDLVAIFEAMAQKYQAMDLERYKTSRDFLAQYAESEMAKKDVIATEKSFEIEVGGFKLIGFIDRIDYLGDGRYGVRDYKTSFVKKDESEMRNDLQCITYDIALRKMIEAGEFPGMPEPVEVECTLIYLRHGDVSVVYTDEEREEALSYIEYMGHVVNMIDEEPVPQINSFCRYCEFRGNCSLYNGDFTDYLDGTILEDSGELAHKLQDLRNINKVTRARIDEIQKILLQDMNKEQLRVLATPYGDVKLCTNRTKRINEEAIKGQMEGWTKYAKIDSKKIEENGTMEEVAILRENTEEFDTAPYVRVFKKR